MKTAILAVAGAACAIGGVAWGQTASAPASTPPAKPGVTTPARVAPDPFSQMLAARGVAEFARREHDAAAMIVAARMLQQIPFSGEDTGEAAFTPNGLFEEAKQLAKGDHMLLMQIQVAQSTGSRGVAISAFGKGLVRKVQTVQPRTNYEFTVQAVGGEPLRVGAIGDVNTALAMNMRDGTGKTVCLDDHGDYGPVCQLTPARNAAYRIQIQNKSGVSSRAVILSN